MAVFNQDTTLEVSHKKDRSPVTQADLNAHDVIERGLEASGFSWPILSEESWPVAYETRKAWPTYWLVDPLDGTKEFISGSDEFTVNIALISHHKPVWGAVYAPATGTTYWGGKGIGAWQCTGHTKAMPIRAHDLRKRLQGAQPLRVATSVRHGLEALSRFKDNISKIYPNLCFHPKGSSLKLCAIAAGEADIYPRFGPTSEWDIAAGQAVLEGAGGSVSIGLNGHPVSNPSTLSYNTKDSIINPSFIAHGINANALVQQFHIDQQHLQTPG